MAESPPLRRRWFRYSLRTLFVVVTLVGCASGWLGSQVALVHRRKEILVRLNATVVTDEQEKSDQLHKWTMSFWSHQSHGTPQASTDSRSAKGKATRPPPRLPFWRKWLGDNDEINSITLPVEATAADMEQIRTLFPEIHIWRRLRPIPPHEVYDNDYAVQKRS